MLHIIESVLPEAAMPDMDGLSRAGRALIDAARNADDPSARDRANPRGHDREGAIPRRSAGALRARWYGTAMSLGVAVAAQQPGA